LKPTIRDIAEAASVSTAAVSYVINDKPGVSDDTRRRVLKIMREMRYRPNPQAKGLADRRTGMIGLMIPDITDSFYVNVVRGVEATANQLGYTLNLCTTHGDGDRERDVAERFASGGVDGVIMMTYRLAPSELKDLGSRRAPVVAIDNPDAAGWVPSLVVDNVELGRTATSYLLELGHLRIGFVHGVEGSVTSESRYQGYLQALGSYGVEPSFDLVVYGGFAYDGGAEAARRLLSMPDRPTAIFAANDQMALGVISAAAELGLTVPDDVSVIGVDDIEASSLVAPGLTTLRQPTWEMGACAVQTLVDIFKATEEQSEGEAAGPQAISKVFQAELVVRGSCIARRHGSQGAEGRQGSMTVRGL